jgi:hypothetical protein
MVKIYEVFSSSEIKSLKKSIDTKLKRDCPGIDTNLGRYNFGGIVVKKSRIYKKLKKIAKEHSNKNLIISGMMAVEYSNKYGEPNLPPHYDADTNDLIINYQLSSNTSWDIGLDLKTYSMEDNSALVFNPNQYMHWRPIKEFKDGEYVRMIFIRFRDSESPSDYSNLNYWQNDEIFKDARTYRSMLNRFEKTKLGKSEGEK